MRIARYEPVVTVVARAALSNSTGVALNAPATSARNSLNTL